LELIGVLRREDRLADALKELRQVYDFIIIDCPPSLGLLTLNGLMAANQVLIPVEPGYFPLIGLGLLQDTITSVARINHLAVLGVVPTFLIAWPFAMPMRPRQIFLVMKPAKPRRPSPRWPGRS
jgi:chromosome partitioning protein